MRILILEDDPERQQCFQRNLVGHDVIITDKAKTAIQLLSDQEWGLLCLDHDLGGQVYVKSGEGTGYEVAVWLEEHPDRQPPQIILHSLNPAGRENMKRCLPGAIDLPFAWVKIHTLIE